MAGPWEDFATTEGPWTDFAKPVEQPKKARSDGRNTNIGVGEAALSMGTGLIAKPVSDIAGLTRLGMEGLRRAGVPGIDQRDPMTVQQDVQRALTYSPRTDEGKFIAEYNPLALIGKGVNWLADKAEAAVAPSDTSGPVRNALGYGVHEVVNQLPVLAGIKAPAAAAATKAAGTQLGRDVMQSALKPPLASLQTGSAARAIDTLLDEGINVTKGGAEKLRARVELINDNIKDHIQNSPAVVDKNAVTSRMQGLVDKFRKQVAPLSDVASIQKVWNEFMDHPLINGDTIPVKVAQEMKQGTYKALGSKAYGELKGAEIEAQKEIARGLKDEIAKAVPAVRELNAEESSLLNALSLVERRALISANKNPIGLGWLSTNPVHFAGFMADRSELFKSLVGRMLSSSAKAIPEMNVAGPVAGAITTNQADQR